MSNLQMSTTHKINIADLNVKLNGQREYMPYKLNINNSVDTFLKIRETLTRVGRLQEGKNGFVFKSESVNDIKQALKKIMNTKESDLIAMSDYSNTLSKSISPKLWVESLLRMAKSK
jgi:hypothetical protein